MMLGVVANVILELGDARGVETHTTRSDPLYFEKVRGGTSRETSFGGLIPREGTETGLPGVGHNTGIAGIHTQTPISIGYRGSHHVVMKLSAKFESGSTYFSRAQKCGAHNAGCNESQPAPPRRGPIATPALLAADK
jgi:hypothetical protein